MSKNSLYLMIFNNRAKLSHQYYYNINPYSYCGGNPVNAIDPDGEPIIFINGNHFGDEGTSAYWNGVDNQIFQ